MLKKYPCLRSWALVKLNLQEAISFRVAFIFQILSNVIYLIIISSLWKAIYNSVPQQSLNGMEYRDTILYLALAIGMFSSMQVYLVENMSWEIRSGGVIFFLLKPLSYQTYVVGTFVGKVVTQFISIFIPTIIFTYIVTGETLLFGLNIIVFLFSYFMAILISLSMDFLISLICFYIESSWGLCIVKDTVTMLFSGVMIPIALLPDTMKKITAFLPFQAIYNVPIQFMTKKMEAIEGLKLLGQQAVWLILLWLFGKYCFNRIAKVITVNGG